MISEEKKKVVERWFFEFFTKGYVNVIDDVTTDEFIYHGAGGDATRQKLKDFMGWYRTCFQDDEWELHDFIEQDHKLVVRYTGHSTYKGGWFNIPSSNQRIKETGIMIYHFKGNKVNELWCELSDTNVLYQLDALPKGTHETFEN